MISHEYIYQILLQHNNGELYRARWFTTKTLAMKFYCDARVKKFKKHIYVPVCIKGEGSRLVKELNDQLKKDRLYWLEGEKHG